MPNQDIKISSYKKINVAAVSEDTHLSTAMTQALRSAKCSVKTESGHCAPTSGAYMSNN